MPTKDSKPEVIIVAGGLGTRMESLSRDVPKCLVNLNGKPIILHQIEFFRSNGYTKFVFCIGHLGAKIKEYFKDGSRFGVDIIYSEENGALLGTAGSVRLAKSRLNNTFIVYYGDSLTNEDFDEVLDFHRQKNSDFTVVLRELPKDYASSSVIVMDDDNRIKAFFEKPGNDELKSGIKGKKYINNGIYFIEPEILQEVPPKAKYDFGGQLIPKLIEKNRKVYGYVSHKLFAEIGRVEKFGEFDKKLKGGGIEDGWKQSGFFR